MNKKKKAKVHFRTPAQLEQQKERMWQLVKSVANCEETYWKSAFADTQLYAIYTHESEIIGFSSVMEHDFRLGSKHIYTIGLGQTLVMPAFRNQYLVQRALIYRWWRRFIRKPLSPIYIWGACISYKSYLSFVKVLKVVYPHPLLETPPQAKAVMDQIGEYWYGREYEAGSQLCITRNFTWVDESTRPLAKDLSDPFIAYYAQKVPILNGDTPGILTVSPCIRANFLPMVWGWVRKIGRKKPSKPKVQIPAVG